MEIVVELSTLNVFHHQVELSLGVYYIVQSHDVPVLKFFEDADFSDNIFLPRRLHQVKLFINFDGKDKTCRDVNSLFDRSIGSLT